MILFFLLSFLNLLLLTSSFINEDVLNNTNYLKLISDNILINVGINFYKENLGNLVNESIYKFEEVIKNEAEIFTTFVDGEQIDALERYFWGLTNGVALELGALDGLSLSTTRPLLNLGWNRILIEGSPSWCNDLKKNSIDALSFCVPICRKEGKVHYSSSQAVGGIIEYMSNEFREKFHIQTTYLPVTEWKNIKGMHEISCLPVKLLLKYTNINKINLWILDVEGAELEVLKTVDWNSTSFDVIAIEINKNIKDDKINIINNEYRDNITAYLKENNYKLDWEYGRNAWYVIYLPIFYVITI